jgi:hypothetical protein
MKVFLKIWVCFFSVEHNVDESEIALTYVSLPVCIRQHGSILSEGLGVCYLYFKDELLRILNGKRDQLPVDMQGVIFLDLTNVVGRLSHHESSVIFGNNIKHFSAVLILKDGNYSNGFRREMNIIENDGSSNPLSEPVKIFLENLTTIRSLQSLM